MAEKDTIAAGDGKAKTDDMLDKALADSFPASDPVSVETKLIPGRPVKRQSEPTTAQQNEPTTGPQKKGG